MSQPRTGVGRTRSEWDRIAARLAGGAGLSPGDVRRILSGIKREDDRESLDAALRQWLDDEAATAVGGAPAVAEIPAPTARPSRELHIAHDAFGANSERIRALRTELLLRQRAADRRTLAVVSPGADEGRSRLAAELAIAFAQTGEPTLLVDADLRRPRQRDLFGGAGIGLAEALADGGTARPEGVHELPNLALLTAGTPPRNPLELLSGPRFEELMAGWSTQFRHVILDTPPAAACADAVAVAAQSGAALVVCRAGRTGIEALRELQRQLSLTPARVLGCALNRF
jgi:protein-tyrosine kinase